MKILVCGGRDYADKDKLFAVLDDVHAKRGITKIISGCALGADSLAVQWAAERGVETILCPPDREKWGNAANVVRNRTMLLHYPEGIVVFGGGKHIREITEIAEKMKIGVLKVT